MLGEAVCAGALLTYSLAVHVTWRCYNGLAAEYATTVSLGASDGKKRLAACAEWMQANVRRFGGAALGEAVAVCAQGGGG